MISEYQYKILKLVGDSNVPLTYNEILDKAATDYEGNEFVCVKTALNVLPASLFDYRVRENGNAMTYTLSDLGKKAMEEYEWFLNYKDETTKTIKGNAFVVYEHKGGLFMTGVGNYAYTTVAGLTSDVANAQIFRTEEEAQQLIDKFWKDSPCKYQNKDSYKFSVVPVTISTKVVIPKTFVCNKCGKVKPINKRYVSTRCPDSWETGMCDECARIEKMARERRERGVFAYESID